MNRLYWNTVSDPLRHSLELLMSAPLFTPFRLVGGTSLSLQIGHRMSVDIDLFTDAPYRSISFPSIDEYLRNQYPYVSRPVAGEVGMGSSYIAGNAPDDAIKLDLYYTDNFIRRVRETDGIRLATIEEITAMKLHVVQQQGRKKDF